MDVSNGLDWVINAGQVVGAMGAMYGVVHVAAVRPLKRKFDEEIETKVAEQLEPVASDIGEVKAQICAVFAEVSPNSGHSVKDVVDRTETKVDALGQRFYDHLINHPRG